MNLLKLININVGGPHQIIFFLNLKQTIYIDIYRQLPSMGCIIIIDDYFIWLVYIVYM